MGREKVACSVEGCVNPVMLRDRRFGKPYYRTVCQKHHRRKTLRMLDGVCSRCGWRGKVHQHREVPESAGGTYDVGNVVPLCPNDHLAAHGKGTPNQRQVYDKATSPSCEN